MRVVFLGTPEFAVPSLRTLIENSCEIVAVYTQPDRPSGRGQRLRPSPVKVAALEAGLHVYQPERIRGEEHRAAIEGLQADFLVVAAYGQILPGWLLRAVRVAPVNVHGSLLPRYRGAAPVAWAILSGDRVTGVTTMWMNAGIDTGDVILQRYTPIHPEENAGELAGRLSQLGARLLVETVRAVERGAAPRLPQDPQAGSYCRKLRKEHGVILWQQDAERVARHVRAMTPWPGAHTVFEPAAAPGAGEAHGQALLVEQARVLDRLPRETPPGRVLGPEQTGPVEGVVVACRRGALELVTVRPAGKRSMPAAAWWHGLRGAAGHFLCPGGGE